MLPDQPPVIAGLMSKPLPTVLQLQDGQNTRVDLYRETPRAAYYRPALAPHGRFGQTFDPRQM